MIYLLRHTKPDVESGICYGVTDLELDPKGYKLDIEKAIGSVEDICFKAIYSSPLKRCRELAEAVAKPRQQQEQLVFDSRLKELNFGDWEMMLWDDIFLNAQSRDWFDNYIETATPNGESFRDMICRANSFLSDLEGENEGDILVVTHSGFIRAALVATNRATPSEAFEKRIEYGELVKLEI